MASRRSRVHPRRRHRPVLAASVHDVHHFVGGAHANFSGVLDVEALNLVFLDLQVCLFGIQQVHDLLHVDFEVAALNMEFEVTVRLPYQLKQEVEHARNQTLQLGVTSDTFHGK